jgi:hypothetical protein
MQLTRNRRLRIVLLSSKLPGYLDPYLSAFGRVMKPYHRAGFNLILKRHIKEHLENCARQYINIKQHHLPTKNDTYFCQVMEQPTPKNAEAWVICFLYKNLIHSPRVDLGFYESNRTAVLDFQIYLTRRAREIKSDSDQYPSTFIQYLEKDFD